MKENDIIGKKYGRLTVVKFSHTNKNHKRCYICKCDCGKEVVVLSNSIRTGNTMSCGCLKEEEWFKKITKHGLYETKLYKIWGSIIQRVKNKKSKDYNDYGGRGITICPEWEKSFQSFYDWAMSHGYKEGLSIDRIDNEGNYYPENCRWATAYQQSRNKRNNVYIEYKGERYCLKDWETIKGFKKSFIEKILKRKNK